MYKEVHVLNVHPVLNGTKEEVHSYEYTKEVPSCIFKTSHNEGTLTSWLGRIRPLPSTLRFWL
jgi:hypothetical protein